MLFMLWMTNVWKQKHPKYSICALLHKAPPDQLLDPKVYNPYKQSLLRPNIIMTVCIFVCLEGSLDVITK